MVDIFNQQEVNTALGKFYDKNTGIRKYCNQQLGTDYAFNEALHAYLGSLGYVGNTEDRKRKYFVDLNFPSLDLDFIKGEYRLRGTDGYSISVNPLDVLTFSRPDPTLAFDENGVLSTVPAGQPVIEYDPATGANRGLRIWEQHTNSLLDNRDLSTGNWGGSPAASISQDETGVDGAANTAWTITDDDSGNVERISFDPLTVADDSSTHTVSVYIKKDSDETRFPSVRADIVGGTTIVRYDVSLNTSTGAYSNIVSSGTGTVDVEDAGDWWCVCISTTNNGTGNTALGFDLFPARGTSLGGSDASATGSIVYDFGGIYLNTSVPGPPIETQGSAVTVGADDAEITDMSWFNADVGTFVIECDVDVLDERGIILSTVPTGSPNALLAEVNNGTFRVSDWNGPSESITLQGAKSFKAAFTYSGASTGGGSLKTAANGSLTSGNTQFDLSGDQTSLLLGRLSGGNQFYYYGAIGRITYFPTQFTDAALQEVTS